MVHQGNLFTIPASAEFADSCAKFVLDKLQEKNVYNNPFAITDITIYVPSPRVARVISKAFVQHAGSSVLVPKIKPLSVDVELLEKQYFSTKALNILSKKTISPLRRQLFLSRLIEKLYDGVTTAKAMDSANKLGQLLDRLSAHKISLQQLQNIVPQEFSSHWQKTLEFLKLISNFYPEWLQEEGGVDQGIKNADVLNLLAEKISAGETGILTVAAGFSDTTPSGLSVIKAIASSPDGLVIFPNLNLNQSLKQVIGPTHPQFGMHQILKAIGSDVSSVKIIGKQSDTDKFWHSVFNHSEPLEGFPTSTLENLTIVEAHNLQHEASCISLAMAQSLLDKKQTCALVTPDRKLATAVSSILKAKGINFDDSAGMPISQTPVGSLWIKVCKVILSNFSAVPVASLLSDNLIDEPNYNLVEKYILRSNKPKSGLLGLFKKLGQVKSQPELSAENADKIKQALEDLEKNLKPLLQLNNQSNKSSKSVAEHGAKDWLNAQIQVIQNLLGDKLEDQDYCDDLIQTLNTWVENEDILGNISFNQYYGYVNALLTGKIVRPKPNGAKAFIWGPLEARLQNVDRVILSGLNEGTWPRRSEGVAWLSPIMQKQLGLPAPESSVGLSAHDFLGLVNSKDIILSRSLKQDGSETIPSRFLTKLQIVIGIENWNNLKSKGQYWSTLLDSLNLHEKSQTTSCSSISLKSGEMPLTWSASGVKDLMTCPYKFYLQRVMKLKPLEDFNKLPQAAEKGQIIHLIFQAFYEQIKDLPPPFGKPVNSKNANDAKQHLLHIGKIAFELLDEPQVSRVWQPRFEGMVEGFVNLNVKLGQLKRSAYKFEYTGYLKQGNITLTATADRVDKTPTGSILIDYKTGAPPTAKQVKQGLQPQMAVEGLILAKGGYKGVANSLEGLEFWHLKGDGEQGVEQQSAVSKKTPAEDLQALIEKAQQGISKLDKYFVEQCSPLKAYPADNFSLKDHCKYCDYATICRFKEWACNDR